MKELGAAVLKYLSQYASSGILLLDIKPLLSFKKVSVNTHVCSSNSLFLASFACSIVGRLKSMTLSLLPGTAGIVVNLYILEEQHVEFI